MYILNTTLGFTMCYVRLSQHIRPHKVSSFHQSHSAHWAFTAVLNFYRYRFNVYSYTCVHDNSIMVCGRIKSYRQCYITNHLTLTDCDRLMCEAITEIQTRCHLLLQGIHPFNSFHMAYNQVSLASIIASMTLISTSHASLRRVKLHLLCKPYTVTMDGN